MIRLLRLIGSLAFVVGLFTMFFIAVPWIVTVANDPNIGGPLPWWVKGAVYSLIAGILIVLLSIGLEQLFASESSKDVLAQADEDLGIVVSNVGEVTGRTIDRQLGLVQGGTIYAIWLGNDISALLRLVTGGELTEYTELMNQARKLAIHRMCKQAKELGADAVIGVRLTTASVVGTAAELLAYGTAVKFAVEDEEE